MKLAGALPGLGITGKGKRGKRRKGKKKFNPCTPFFEETDTWYEAGCHKRKRK